MVYIVQNYYGLYGGATGQYPMYGTSPAGGVVTGAAAAFYPYLQYGSEGNGGAAAAAAYGSSGVQNYATGVQYPHHHHLFQYSAMNSTGAGGYQPYGPPISLAPSPALQTPGICN